MTYEIYLDRLLLSHSFGYECGKRFNLVVLAKDIVAYAAGNLIVILNLDSQKQECFRSIGEEGIGALAVSYIQRPRFWDFSQWGTSF